MQEAAISVQPEIPLIGPPGAKLIIALQQHKRNGPNWVADRSRPVPQSSDDTDLLRSHDLPIEAIDLVRLPNLKIENPAFEGRMKVR